MINLLELANDPASQDVVKTEFTEKLVLDGKAQAYPVYRIKLDKLRYNPHNDRIATWMSRYKADHGENALDNASDEEFNSVIEDFIYKSNPEAIKKTQGNIEMRTQERPGVVLSSGLVIDGNRRFTCLRRLAQKNMQFEYFNAMILPEEYGNDPKRIKILELSIQHATEEKVGYDPIERLVGVYNVLLDSSSDCCLTPAEYAKYTDIAEKEVRRQMEMAQYMTEFLEFIEQPRQFHIARELSLGSFFVEMLGIMKKCSGEEQREEVKSILFSNILVEPKGDSVRFIRPIKQILGSEEASNFIDQELDLAAEVQERLNENADKNIMDSIRELRSDEGFSNQFVDALQGAEREAKRQKAIGSPANSIKKALKELDQVEESIFPHLGSDDLAEIKRAIDELSHRVQQIASAL